jgi:raffinose/stachyose/melibiose transport system permease protein
VEIPTQAGRDIDSVVWRGRTRRPSLSWLGGGVAYVVLLCFALIVAVPMIYTVVDAFKSQNEFYSSNAFALPAHWSFDYFNIAWTLGNIGQSLVNSTIVAGGTIVLTLVCASLAAYAFSAFTFRGGRFLYTMFAILLIIPAPVSIIPLYVLISRLHIMDTYFALILPYTAGSLPLAIFLLHAFFNAIPGELSEAARMDGCTELGAFLRVVLPISTPGLATVTIFTYLGAWNEFFLALIFLHNPDLFTVPLNVQYFAVNSVGGGSNYPALFAALSMSAIPVIAIYIAMQRQFIEGLTAGAVRG